MSSLVEGSVIGGRYRLERVLARGGMGSVWTAQHLQLKVSVAVKLMAPLCAASAQSRARFEREARASAQLKSPNVVQVHDYGVEDDTPYIVMELLEGEDLEGRLARERRLTLGVTLSIVSPICKALRRAHEVGLVHRDLKPANIFVSRHADEEIIKVLDFGIAKVTGTELAGKSTKTGALIGSPHYMSPEQVRRGKEVDHRSDLWSLTVIIFRCLTGQLPFPGEELGEVLVEICSDPIPIASTIAPDLQPDVDRFFERAFMRDPGQRFQSARELLEAFASLVRASGQWAPREEAWSLVSGQPSSPSLESGSFAPSASAGTPASFASGESTGAPAPFAPAAPHALQISAQSAASQRDLPKPLAPVGTLAPSGHSLVLPLSAGRRMGPLVVAVAGVVVTLIAAAVFFFRSPTPRDGAALQIEPIAPPSAPGSARAAPLSGPEISGAPPVGVTPARPSAAAPASASASVSSPSRAVSPSPSRGAPTPTTKGQPAHDPLDEM